MWRPITLVLSMCLSLSFLSHSLSLFEICFLLIQITKAFRCCFIGSSVYVHSETALDKHLNCSYVCCSLVENYLACCQLHQNTKLFAFKFKEHGSANCRF